MLIGRCSVTFFPMVVGPRFNPPQQASGVSEEGVPTRSEISKGGGIGAVARGQYGASGQQTEVQYLKPDERSGHDIALTVEVV